MSNQNETFTEKLLSAQVAIDNAISNVEIKSLLSVYGYYDVRIADGKTLLDTTNKVQQTQQK